MLDRILNDALDKPLQKITDPLIKSSVRPLHLTIAAFALGLIAAFAAGIQSYALGLVLIILCRAIDMVEESLGRQKPRASLGAYLNTILTLIYLGALIFMFGLGQGQDMAAGFLLFTIMILTATIYIQPDISKENTSEIDGIWITCANLIGKTETTLFLILAFLFPSLFGALSILYGLLCWLTSTGRVFIAIQGSPKETE